ncbi:bifunctional adenosylcobinamide kinase/adenosylcobinamide-phosphate guanylyltransferase [Roseobacter sinensis]|uniref:Bifunctional adenosylcobalamin biosynthesis protein n=1 Tax=Roseobacter sinensis TaxID=2931391 RepID=A0ABT3BCY9_9RHOB|nr:bifunctional adenosylcobinamide kinase/adenosylcobinamide-phosphate guanylyltransferase [Roseobacter sp. WL0113]MCV3271427.1 bifunctional adenosylcobinamide kinase/adenosylcobinamide-phosphate guanylyltransferase [Roseobacter sp. WL0113]
MLPKLTFVLGGAASGKSVWAENLLLSSALEPVYLATSRVFDDEIKMRVELHRSRRSDRWLNFEAQIELHPVLSQLTSGQAVLIDCATMWLTNLIMDGRDIAEGQADLLSALHDCAAPVVIVSNEVGHGIVPENALARRFREAQGRLNIALAAEADLAVQVSAGLPIVMKGTLP